MKYLKQFETTAAYEAAQSSLILPNVSLTLDNNTVHYSPLVESQFFCKITTLYGGTISIEGSGELTEGMVDSVIEEYKSEIVRAEIGTLCTSIGNDAFRGASITSIDLPDSVTSIGDGAFDGCIGLTEVTIGSGLTSIGNHAFGSCEGLTSITIPGNVTSIGVSAFYHCYGLTEVTIGNGVTSIGNDAFYVCSGLTSITIPNSVTTIGNGAFEACSVLTSVTVNATTPPTLGNSAFDNTNNCPIYVPIGSVYTYESASGWNTYAGRIEAIP